MSRLAIAFVMLLGVTAARAESDILLYSGAFDGDADVAKILRKNELAMLSDIMWRAKLSFTVVARPSQRLIDGIRKDKNSCGAFDSEEFAEKNGFQWIGPALQSSFAVIGGPDEKPIASLDALRGKKIGAVAPPGRTGLLLEKNDIPYDPVNFDELNYMKMQRKRIDYWFGIKAFMEDMYRYYGTKMPPVLYETPIIQVGIECNKDMAPAKIAALKAAVEKFRAAHALDWPRMGMETELQAAVRAHQ